jgi:hypothetical protein
VLQIFLLEVVVFDDMLVVFDNVLELVVFDEILEVVVLSVGFGSVVEMTFKLDKIDAALEFVDLDVVFELLDLDMLPLIFEDEVLLAEVDGFDDELAFDELSFKEDDLALEDEVVERKVWLEVDDLYEVIFDDEIVFEEDDTLVELDLIVWGNEPTWLVDDEERKLLDFGVEVELDTWEDRFELLAEDFEILDDVDSVVGGEVSRVGQRDWGYCPVSDVVIVTVFVTA